uniref:Uncharacterized protein n=1 Tax=viral metagenome TaxID=1070528 RepID=A0A6C0EB02_9ZZZZ
MKDGKFNGIRKMCGVDKKLNKIGVLEYTYDNGEFVSAKHTYGDWLE